VERNERKATGRVDSFCISVDPPIYRIGGESVSLAFLARVDGAELKDGQFKLRVHGPAQMTVPLEASEDQAAWRGATAVTIPAGGFVDLVDAGGRQFTQRFYRVAFLP